MAETSNTKRIAKNTLMLYFRQILIMAVSLYTVRVVLNILGANDYGIYNVVAGVVTMFNFLSNSMATASQRYFSYDLGVGNQKRLNETFSITFEIYLILIIVILLIAETAGVFFINTKLVIPDDRIIAANWIYQFAIISFCLTFITAPFMACIIAHEDMNVYAYVSIIEALLKLGIVFLLSVFSFDKLILYGLLLVVVSAVITSLYRFYCHKKYEECHFHFYWNKALFKEIISYSGWNLFGASVGVIKNQCTNIILNIYFGPVVNAARGIASQVNAAIISFSNNFSTAIRPQIIKSYASGKKDEMVVFMFNSARFTFFLMFFMALPIYFNLENLLELWLKEVPEHSLIFTRLILIDVTIESISFPFGTGIQATGRIKWYQIIVGTLLLLNLPISWIFLHNGFSPEIVFYIAIVITCSALILRLFFMKYIIGFRFFSRIFMTNFFRMVLTSAVCIIVSYFIYKEIDNYICNLLVLYFIELLILFALGLNRKEIKFVITKLLSKVKKD